MTPCGLSGSEATLRLTAVDDLLAAGVPDREPQAAGRDNMHAAMQNPPVGKQTATVPNYKQLGRSAM